MDDRMRVSDADREALTARLRDHYAEGRLTQDELDERVSAALSAKTFGELRSLTTDLPGPAVVPPHTAARPSWGGPPPWRRYYHRRPPVPLILLIALLVVLSLGRRLGGVRVLPADPGVLAGDDADPHRHRPGAPAGAPLPVGRGAQTVRAAPMRSRPRHGLTF